MAWETQAGENCSLFLTVQNEKHPNETMRQAGLKAKEVKVVLHTIYGHRGEQTFTGIEKNLHGNLSTEQCNVNTTNHLNHCLLEAGRIG